MTGLGFVALFSIFVCGMIDCVSAKSTRSFAFVFGGLGGYVGRLRKRGRVGTLPIDLVYIVMLMIFVAQLIIYVCYSMFDEI